MSIREKIDPLESVEAPVSANPSVPLASHTDLPERPVIKIRPADTWTGIDLGEVWAHRELFYLLVWRDLKVRYKQTFLGFTWAILQPLLLALVFTVFLGRLMRVPSDGIPYSAFAYVGLLAWSFFANACMGASYSLIGNAHLIKKVYFPRLLIPCAVVAVRLIDFLAASLILMPMLLYQGITPAWSLLIFPLLVLELTLLSLGFGLLLATLNTKYRDIGTLLPVALQLWMFVSPVVYPLTLVPEQWRSVYALNPIVGIIEGMRGAVFGRELDSYAIAVSAMITVSLLIFSVYCFRRAEEKFADVV
ncbi:MAG TPA: ABC transporter permease [Pyrinomonadaceae bacterium]|nr:ABC transporter permease [Pyrinomonadaceae bacterium]